MDTAARCGGEEKIIDVATVDYYEFSRLIRRGDCEIDGDANIEAPAVAGVDRRHEQPSGSDTTTTVTKTGTKTVRPVRRRGHRSRATAHS